MGHLRKWARIVCIGDSARPGCGALMVDAAKVAALPRGRRLTAAGQISAEGRKCHNHAPPIVHPSIEKDKEDYITLWAETGSGEKRIRWKLQPAALKAAFERVTDETVRALGEAATSHPKHFLLRVIR